ncbi:N-6 DNA Methylase [Asanoa ishikariensis]|uniref:N-6 DNA Methylase n=1 Tax=Asanoa ishikariensis TaxID=137265 RepID=A0A1H3S1V0_9ACTN|nr:N-6 DNA methylase [Asanoa ishikariensis]SDZ31441.1 N-6 DNA Methylase [Asanoa ishikariensis]
MPENAKVTATEIARLAGVGRAAVSNWRKRHTDFPDPVGGTASSPEFDLPQVEEWLRDQGKLPEVSVEDRAWARLAATGSDIAANLGAVGELLLAHQRGEKHGTQLLVLPEIADLLHGRKAEIVFEELWRRFAQTQAWRVGLTPEALSDLMVGLADPKGGTLFDPACGAGSILRSAVRSGSTVIYGQEIDAGLAHLAEMWVALGGVRGEVRAGDSLRADSFPELRVDAVVSNIPFGDTNWGHDELGYDPRWEYGAPPRTEPELAWVQHALAHLRPGGSAVVLMPPSAASRRAGRRIRSELLRRGALRAVISLPAKAAAPHSIPLHLWVLRRPEGQAPAAASALLVDAADGEPALGYERIVATYRAFDRDEAVDEPGFARAVPVIELLDQDVDLTPARRQPAASAAADAADFAGARASMLALVARVAEVMPDLAVTDDPATPPTVSVSDLARSGALRILGPVRPAGGEGTAIALEPGDVLVPTVARQLTARVVGEEGGSLGVNLLLLRPDPDALDPWFLAGQIGSVANERQAASASGAYRFDVRRAQIPRRPLDQQRRVGEAFRQLAVFEEVVRQTATAGVDLVRTVREGLAGGALHPGDTAQ